MSIIRNLTALAIELDDLSGITLEASADRDISNISTNEVSSSIDLLTNIQAGNIVYLDSNSQPLSTAESTSVQDGYAAPAIAVVAETSLAELSDVLTTMTPADGQVLTFDTTNGWQPETPGAGGAHPDPHQLAAGSATAPTYSFAVDTNTGMYQSSTDTLSFATTGTERLRIESNGTLSVIGTSNYENLVTADDDIPNKKYVDAALPIFGTEFHQASSDGTSSSSEDNLEQKLRLTTSSLPSGTYRIGYSYEWNLRGSTTNDFIGRIQINNSTTIAYHQEEPKDSASNQWRDFSGFYYHTGSGVLNIDIDYGPSNGDFGTPYIRRARLELWRVS